MKSPAAEGRRAQIFMTRITAIAHSAADCTRKKKSAPVIPAWAVFGRHMTVWTVRLFSRPSVHCAGVNRSTPATRTCVPVSPGWFSPSSTVTSAKSNGLMPSRQATLTPYSFVFERR